jgi:hypothetical protein
MREALIDEGLAGAVRDPTRDRPVRESLRLARQEAAVAGMGAERQEQPVGRCEPAVGRCEPPHGRSRAHAWRGASRATSTRPRATRAPPAERAEPAGRRGRGPRREGPAGGKGTARGRLNRLGRRHGPGPAGGGVTRAPPARARQDPLAGARGLRRAGGADKSTARPVGPTERVNAGLGQAQEHGPWAARPTGRPRPADGRRRGGISAGRPRRSRRSAEAEPAPALAPREALQGVRAAVQHARGP